MLTDGRTDGQTDGWTDGRTENRTPISHPATSRCDKNDHLWSFFYIIYTFLGSIFELCCIQNRVIMKLVIKRLMCISLITDPEFKDRPIPFLVKARFYKLPLQ